MRVSSLCILAIIVLGAVYFIFLTPQWAIDLYLQGTGYGPASTATEAQDKFLKCVKNRDLKTAALFCTGEYANHLKRGAVTAPDMGPVIDGISAYMKNKGLDTDKSIILLHYLDPFPTNVKMRSAPKERDAASALLFFEEENILKRDQPTSAADVQRDLSSVDARMFTRVLVPYNLFDPRGVEAVKEGDAWKLKFVPPPPAQVQALDHYLANCKAYSTGLTVFNRDVTNDRYPGKSDFERELVSVLTKAK